MEDNSCLHDVDVHYLHACIVLRNRDTLGARVGNLLGEASAHVSLAEVLDEEGDEDAGHADGGGGALVLDALDAAVLEHEHRVDEKLRCVALAETRTTLEREQVLRGQRPSR